MQDRKGALIRGLFAGLAVTATFLSSPDDKQMCHCRLLLVVRARMLCSVCVCVRVCVCVGAFSLALAHAHALGLLDLHMRVCSPACVLLKHYRTVCRCLQND